MEMPKIPIEGVKYLITVGSGKGGVGKTTVSVNLALALRGLGHRVGLLDADVYGPNVPRMMGINESPQASGESIAPIVQQGVKPMLHSLMQQFIRNVLWGPLDYLIVDLPPGTGDVSLSLAQSTPITGAIVVTTPSDVSLEDARKAVLMFRQLHVPMLGLVENMSYLVVPNTGERIDVFGEGGGRRTADQMQIPLLGELPLVPEVRRGGDSGRPAALSGEDAAIAQPFFTLARTVIGRVEQTAANKGPTIAVED
jgi:ATP-binding protein involved in chromosome partitioning